MVVASERKTIFVVGLGMVGIGEHVTNWPKPKL